MLLASDRAKTLNSFVGHNAKRNVIVFLNILMDIIRVALFTHLWNIFDLIHRNTLVWSCRGSSDLSRSWHSKLWRWSTRTCFVIT